MNRIFSHLRASVQWGRAAGAALGCVPADSSAPETGRTSSDVSLRCGDELRPTARGDVSFHLSQTRTGDGPFEIVTTVGMVTDIVRHVAGDRAHVTGLMSEGVDPHLYQATRDDVQKLIEADVVFYSGLNLEHRMQDVFDRQAKNRQAGVRGDRWPLARLLASPPEFDGYPRPARVGQHRRLEFVCPTRLPTPCPRMIPRHGDLCEKRRGLSKGTRGTRRLCRESHRQHSRKKTAC